MDRYGSRNEAASIANEVQDVDIPFILYRESQLLSQLPSDDGNMRRICFNLILDETSFLPLQHDPGGLLLDRRTDSKLLHDNQRASFFIAHYLGKIHSDLRVCDP